MQPERLLIHASRQELYLHLGGKALVRSLLHIKDIAAGVISSTTPSRRTLSLVVTATRLHNRLLQLVPRPTGERLILACFHDLFDLTEIDGSVVQTSFVREQEALVNLIHPTRKVRYLPFVQTRTRSTQPSYRLGSQPAEALVFLQCSKLCQTGC